MAVAEYLKSNKEAVTKDNNAILAAERHAAAGRAADAVFEIPNVVESDQSYRYSRTQDTRYSVTPWVPYQNGLDVRLERKQRQNIKRATWLGRLAHQSTDQLLSTEAPAYTLSVRTGNHEEDYAQFGDLEVLHDRECAGVYFDLGSFINIKSMQKSRGGWGNGLGNELSRYDDRSHLEVVYMVGHMAAELGATALST